MNISSIMDKEPKDLTDEEALFASEYLFTFLADDYLIPPVSPDKRSITLMNGKRIVHVKYMQMGVMDGEVYGYFDELVYSKLNKHFEHELLGMNWKTDNQIKIDTIRAIRDNDLKMILLSEVSNNRKSESDGFPTLF